MEKGTHISRAVARVKLLKHWLKNYTPRQLLERSEPPWDRMRNYELEAMLSDDFGGEWCISEPCPFNGAYCRFGTHEGPDGRTIYEIREAG